MRTKLLKHTHTSRTFASKAGSSIAQRSVPVRSIQSRSLVPTRGNSCSPSTAHAPGAWTTTNTNDNESLDSGAVDNLQFPTS